MQDVITKLRPGMSQDDMLRMIRTLVLVICAASYLIALVNPESLIATLLIAYAAIVQLLPLILSTLFWPRATRAGAFFRAHCRQRHGAGLHLLLVPAAGHQCRHPGPHRQRRGRWSE